MPEDRSLDEFAGDDADSAGGPPDDGDGRGTDAGGVDTDGEATTDATEAVDADPATPTATWTTDGAACDRCDEPVARRWLDDGALVCAACKEW